MHHLRQVDHLGGLVAGLQDGDFQVECVTRRGVRGLHLALVGVDAHADLSLLVVAQATLVAHGREQVLPQPSSVRLISAACPSPDSRTLMSRSNSSFSICCLPP